ncbi:peptidase inhibitor family I36 protein [Embleya sp. NBC_00896]|uniref:peptidase inhibitor family I36 protein n=1 Tax=Embleya sp. NBC_00896 TaxID=2975961 RepID=UPI002F90E805|nr:peptidase inhibitor family I36 protein [Embleya sp. NBC_00896]
MSEPVEVTDRGASRKLTTIGAGLVASALLGAIALAPTADASVADSCPRNTVCVYTGEDRTGTRTVIPARVVEETGDIGYTVAQPVRSLANRTGFDLLAGTSRPAICIRFPCYQYELRERVLAGWDAMGLVDTGSEPLVIGVDFGP